MIGEFRASTRRLLGLQCVAHKSCPDDLLLVGRYGVIYPFGDGQFWQIIVISRRVTCRHIRGARDSAPEDEHGLKVTESEARVPRQWITRLAIPNSWPGQIKNLERLFPR